MSPTLAHLKVDPSALAPRVLMPGDPARVDEIGKKLDNFTILGQNREFRIGVGTYKSVPITVCSTGIGCPSTAIAAEELIDAGAQYLMRVGTCGGAWRSDIPLGNIIIPSASVRDEGTTNEYIPQGFPAVADRTIVNALVEASIREQQPYIVGINRTHDAYYGALSEITKWGTYLQDQRWKDSDTPIVSSDMECSALFVIASLRGVKAGAVLAVNADPEPLKDRLLGRSQTVVQTAHNPKATQVVDVMIHIALEAMVLLP